MSPLISEPPVVFHWYGTVLKYWRPTDSGVDKFKVDYSSCAELKAVLTQLEDSIGESVDIMTDDKVWSERKIVFSPTFYKLKYFPEDMMGSISLTNIEHDPVQWVPAAKKVIAIVEKCIAQ